MPKVTKIVQRLKFATQSYKIDLYAEREQINFRILYSDAYRVRHLLFFADIIRVDSHWD